MSDHLRLLQYTVDSVYSVQPFPVSLFDSSDDARFQVHCISHRVSGAGPGGPSRLFEKHPNVQRAAFGVANHYLSKLGRVELGGASKDFFHCLDAHRSASNFACGLALG